METITLRMTTSTLERGKAMKPNDVKKMYPSTAYGKLADPQPPRFAMSRGEWIKAGLYIGVLVVLACIGLCGCDDGGAEPQTDAQTNIQTNTDAGTDAEQRWKTGKIPVQCEVVFKERWGYLIDCPPAYACWSSEGAGCRCVSGPTCAAKARREYGSDFCICTGMPGDWTAL